MNYQPISKGLHKRSKSEIHQILRDGTASIQAGRRLRRLGHDRNMQRVAQIFDAMDWFLGVVASSRGTGRDRN